MSKKPGTAFLDERTKEGIFFSYGVILGQNQDQPFGSTPDRTAENPDECADFWVIEPSEHEDTLSIVASDGSLALRDRFVRWLRISEANPEHAAIRIYVPELSASRTDAGRRACEKLCKVFDTEIISYHGSDVPLV